MDAEVVCLDGNGTPQFDLLHSRLNDGDAIAVAFDLLMLNGDDMRREVGARIGRKSTPTRTRMKPASTVPI
jgi:hypothetical protein